MRENGTEDELFPTESEIREESQEEAISSREEKPAEAISIKIEQDTWKPKKKEPMSTDAKFNLVIRVIGIAGIPQILAGSAGAGLLSTMPISVFLAIMYYIFVSVLITGVGVLIVAVVIGVNYYQKKKRDEANAMNNRPRRYPSTLHR
jgi:hypothetical protein